MILDFSPQAFLIALGIFALRVGDMSLDTIRVLFVVRGKKRLAWALGFCQSIIYVVAISQVLTNLQNPLNVLMYAAGFATGNVVGMFIEERLAIGHMHMSVMSSCRGAAIADALRKEGYGVTEISGRGLNGMVALLHVDVIRRRLDAVQTIILANDPEAFITAEEVRPLRRGFWRA